MARPLAKKELPLKDALQGVVNGKKVRGRRRYQTIDIIMINGLYGDTKRKGEKRIELGGTLTNSLALSNP